MAKRLIAYKQKIAAEWLEKKRIIIMKAMPKFQKIQSKLKIRNNLKFSNNIYYDPVITHVGDPFSEAASKLKPY